MTSAALQHTDDPASQLDEQVAPWPLPADEAARVVALHDFGVLDQPPAADLQAAVRLAAYIGGVPYAAINLIDADRQVQAAAHGRERHDIDRAASICAHVVTGTDVVHTPDASSDERFSSLAIEPAGAVRRYAAAPLVTAEGHAIGTVAVFNDEVGGFTGEQLDLLRDLAGQVMVLFEVRRLTSSLARAASSDLLTGLANRRTVEHAIAKAVARAERGNGTPSVAVVDLDGFSRVNEVHGHAVGHSVLRAVAERLRDTARTVDTVARVGVDEFVVLFEHTGGPGAAAALDRLRGALDDVAAGASGRPAVRAALGITTYRPGDSVATMLSRADAEMYADKASHG